MSRPLRNPHQDHNNKSSIVVYIIDHHPLDVSRGNDPFRWLHPDDGFIRDLSGIIGPFDPENLSVLEDASPSGPAWKQLLDSLVSGEIGAVVTHLAPLSSGQRQQLIGVCAFIGASLITPGDGGRNSFRVHPPS